MNSLRWRIIVTLFTILVAMLTVWTGYSVWDSRQERSRLYDKYMRADAEFALRALPKQLLTSGGGDGFRLAGESLLGGTETSFYMQAWSADGRLLMVTPNAPKQRFTTADVNGFTTVQTDKERWRIYALWDDDHTVQVLVAQSQTWGGLPFFYALINVFKALIMFALFAPITFWVVTWSLKPLKRVREDMLSRNSSDLQDIDTRPVASELRPLVGSFNTLMQRLRDARQSEQRFFTDAAHELRTPLAALRLQAQVALREQDAALRDAALNKLVGGIDRTTRMAEQLLDFAKADNQQSALQRNEIVDLSGLVHETVQSLNWDIAVKRIQVNVQVAPYVVIGQPLLLGIALRNILDNAIRYSPSESKIKIDLGTYGSEKKDVYICVQDQGPGIPLPERANVLTRFYRIPSGSNVTCGSGLGLSIVERVCALHHGRLLLEDADAEAHTHALPGLKISLILPSSGDAIAKPESPLG
jgi:two-component system, OmpR family, sensor histidine kinase QseC